MITEWITHIEFQWPWVFILLALIPFLVWEYLRKRNIHEASLMITTTHFLHGVKSIKTTMLHFPFFLRCVSILFIIIALAGPRQKFTQEKTSGEGIDMVLCFDISGSMTATDFQPNRLEAAKEVATDFVSHRPGDLIGIVLFSSVSFTLCPITSDQQAVLDQIRNIQSGYLQEEGTAIGSGLATSVDRLRSGKSKSKVIILLTDGVDIGGAIPPDIAVQMANLYHIKIYTIGIGSDKEINEVVQSPLGNITEKRKLEFNEGLLENIATKTGGAYFHASDKQALTRIYSSINELEKSKVEVTTYNHYSNKSLPIILIAIALLLLEVILRNTVFRKFP
ncbi:MAG: VWA domain-containing protein [Bacteroidetes bacterium]|nr:VWA domain-containing protein [Bacteroidota bacterium]